MAGTPTITTTAGTGTAGDSGDGGAATQAPINAPPGVAVDGQGNIFLADPGDNAVREVSAATGIITTVAGTGTAGYNGDGIAATQAELNQPRAIAFDRAGDLIIADTNNNRIRTVAGVGLPAPVQSGTVPWHPHQSVRFSDASAPASIWPTGMWTSTPAIYTCPVKAWICRSITPGTARSHRRASPARPARAGWIA